MTNFLMTFLILISLSMTSLKAEELKLPTTSKKDSLSATLYFALKLSAHHPELKGHIRKYGLNYRLEIKKSFIQCVRNIDQYSCMLGSVSKVDRPFLQWSMMGTEQESAAAWIYRALEVAQFNETYGVLNIAGEVAGEDEWALYITEPLDHLRENYYHSNSIQCLRVLELGTVKFQCLIDLINT